MKATFFRVFFLGVLVLFAGLAAAQETPPPPPSPSTEPAPPSAGSDAQEMLRLKEAGYSEEFLLNKIHRENRTYTLSTDDLVALRKAGLSETVIESMLKSGAGTGAPIPSAAPASVPAANAVPASNTAPAANVSSAPAGSPAAAAGPASAPSPSSSPATSPAASPAAPTPSASADSSDLLASVPSFDGLVRQKRGFLGIGGSKKKAIGKLVVDKEQVHWYQSVDPEDNFSTFTKNIKEMWLACAPRAGENLCLELCFKTYSGEEWCFRDTGWENGTNKQITAVFDFFQKAFPATFYSQREKKSF
jgi:hypothetical protein